MQFSLHKHLSFISFDAHSSVCVNISCEVPRKHCQPQQVSTKQKHDKFTHEPLLLIFCDADSQGQADPGGAASDEYHLLVHCAWLVFVLQIQQRRMKEDNRGAVIGEEKALLKPIP